MCTFLNCIISRLYEIVADEPPLPPWLSTHEIFTLSPFFAPLKSNERKGFLDTPGPHRHVRMFFPLCSHLTSVMKCPGIFLPVFLSLRKPVSIGWKIMALIDVFLPLSHARIFIFLAMIKSFCNVFISNYKIK